MRRKYSWCGERKLRGIGKHADEPAEQAQVGGRVDLPLHAFLLIRKPPAAAKLHFRRHGVVLKSPVHCCKDVVVGGVQIVEHGLWKPVVVVELVEVARERSGLRKIADGIKPCVRSRGLDGKGRW